MLNVINANELEKIKKNLTTAFWKVKQDISEIKKADKERDHKIKQILDLVQELKKQLEQPQVKQIEKPVVKPEQKHLIITPKQKVILRVLLEDDRDMYLSYKDLSSLTNMSINAIRLQITRLKKVGIHLEHTTDVNLQVRFKIPSNLKQKYNEVII